MPDNIVLIAVRTDREDVSLPVRGILDALGDKTGPPAHVTVINMEELSARQQYLMRRLFAPDNLAAFQTDAPRIPRN